MTTEAMVRSDIGSGPVGALRPAGPWSAGLIHWAREPLVSTSVAETFDIVASLARRRFGADGAGILLTTESGAASTVASGAQARRADALQVDHREGPGFHAIKGRQPVISAELRFDSRWRFWAPQAADLGLRSVLSLTLDDGEPFGAVTLYSKRRSFFRADSLASSLEFAQQASIAITSAVEREQLLKVADSRGIIGQAQGILMERYRIGADQAFAMIRHSSSALNQKLRLIAERIIDGRSLPDVDLVALPHLLGATSNASKFDDDL